MWSAEDGSNLPAVKTLPELELEDKLSKRKWHDWPCIPLFVLLMSGCVTIILLAFTQGDPSLLPTSALDIVEAELAGFTQTEVAYLKHDVYYILGALLLACLLATVWFYLLRHVTLMVVYQTIVLAVVLLIGLGVYLYQAARRYGTLELYLLGVLAWLAAIAVIVLALLFHDKIGKATELMQDSGKVLVRRPDIMLVVGSAMAIYLTLSGIWLLAFIYLSCVPASTAFFTSVTTTTTLVEIEFNTNYQTLFWILLVGGAWLLPTVFAVETYIIARVALHEYELISDRNAVPFNSMKYGVREALTKSFGSLLFAASLVGLTSVLGYATKYFRRRDPTQWLCLGVLFRFFAYIVELATDATIVYIAYSGKSFLTSAQELSTRAINDASLVLLSETIMTYVLLVGQFCGTALVSTLGIIAIDYRHGHISAASSIVIILVSFLIFRTVARAIFVCFNAGLVHHLLRKETTESSAIERLVQSTISNKYAQV